MDWNAAAPAAIVGAAFATVGVFALELALKPAFARKRVAVILLVEMRLNVRLLEAVIADRREHPEAVPEDFALSDRGWDSVAPELHHLPESALRPLLLQYHQFRELNDLVSGYSRKVDLLLQTDSAAAGRALAAEMDGNSRRFGDSITRVRAQCDRTLPHLERLVDAGPPDFPSGA